MAKKELSSIEHNEAVFAEIGKLQDKIKELKKTVKPVVAVQNASLAHCNALARKKAKK